MKRIFTSVLFVLFYVISIHAQSPQLFQNINTGPGLNGDCNPQNLFIYNNKLWFTGYSATGPSLFSIDENATQVEEIVTLVGASGFCEFNGRMYFYSRGFTGDDMELWTTDGTAAGTYEVKDINPEQESYPYDITPFNGKIYFQAVDMDHGREVFMSDGTEQGTQILKDIYPGSGVENNPQGFTVFNNHLFFAADDGVHGNELWMSDGTEQGTLMLKDIWEGNSQSRPGGYIGIFQEFNGRLYFGAADAENGWEIWSTDGTEEGTTLLKDISPGPDSSNIEQMIVFENRLYFGAKNGKELWRTDGTSEGTELVKSIFEGSGELYPGVAGFYIWDNFLVFSADDGTHGQEPWISDGTTEGTHMIADINPGSAYGGGFAQVAFADRLFFVASTADLGNQLFISDGTESGTAMIAPPNSPFNALYGITIPKTFDNKLFIAAEYDPAIGVELYTLDANITSNYTPPKSVSKIYPNPAESSCFLKIPENMNQASIRVLEMGGRVMLSESVSQNSPVYQLNLNGLSAGLYLIEIENAGHKYYGKVTRK
ncbi:MAG: T9SS type A sorting domain-containing protein [Bacteroidia bacterium]